MVQWAWAVVKCALHLTAPLTAWYHQTLPHTMEDRKMHMDFDAFVRDIEENRWRVHGVTVRRHGQLLHRWGDTDGLHPVYSAAKSVTAMAAGIAMGEGRLSPDTPVLSVLPKAHVSRMSPLQKECFAPLTLHRLMSMSVGGFPFRPQGGHGTCG